MDIYLIRHTKTATLKGLCYGQSDVALADTFPQEAQLIRDKLPELQPDCLIISSPLTRCIKLAETFGKSVIIDDRLLEVNFGDWDNQLFDDINAEQLKQWTENFVMQSPPNGECFNDLCERIRSFWDELILECTTNQVMVITHAGVIRALLTVILQLPPANAFKFAVDVGSIHNLSHINDYTYIRYLNR